MQVNVYWDMRWFIQQWTVKGRGDQHLLSIYYVFESSYVIDIMSHIIQMRERGLWEVRNLPEVLELSSGRENVVELTLSYWKPGLLHRPHHPKVAQGILVHSLQANGILWSTKLQKHYDAKVRVHVTIGLVRNFNMLTCFISMLYVIFSKLLLRCLPPKPLV